MKCTNWINELILHLANCMRCLRSLKLNTHFVEESGKLYGTAFYSSVRTVKGSTSNLAIALANRSSVAVLLLLLLLRVLLISLQFTIFSAQLYVPHSLSNPLFESLKESEKMKTESTLGSSEYRNLQQPPPDDGVHSLKENAQFLTPTEGAGSELEEVMVRVDDGNSISVGENSSKLGNGKKEGLSLNRRNAQTSYSKLRSPISKERYRRDEGREKDPPLRDSMHDFISVIECGKRSLQSVDESDAKEMKEGFYFGVPVDPPMKLIGRFLQRQRESGDVSFDPDTDLMEFSCGASDSRLVERDICAVSEASEKCFGMADAARGSSLSRKSSTCHYPPISTLYVDAVHQPPKEEGMKFKPYPAPKASIPSAHGVGLRESRSMPLSSAGDACPPPLDRAQEVVKDLTRLLSARNFDRLKSKSRLAEPHPPLAVSQKKPCSSGQLEKEQQKQGNRPKSTLLRSGQQLQTSGALKTGFLGKVEEEDDPLKDVDLPEEYLNSKWNIWSILEWLAFAIILAALVCSILMPYFKHRMIWGLQIWKWVLMVMVIFRGGLLSGWIVRVIVFFVEKNFLLRKRVLYFVFGLQKGVQTCMWLMFVLLAWLFLLDPKVEHTMWKHRAMTYVTKVLICFLIGAFIWLIKILLVKVLASSYHVSTYFDRIQESLFNQYILETLSGPPVIEIQHKFNEQKELFEEVSNLRKAGAKISAVSGLLDDPPRRSILLTKSELIGSKRQVLEEGNNRDSGISIEHLQRMNQRNISAWNMKRLVNLVRHTGISTLTHTLDDAADSNDVQIQSEWQAKVAAKQVLKNVAKPGRKYIILDDLLHFMQLDEASKGMALFDGATESGQITKQNLVNWVVNVYKERKALALSLSDTRTAVNKLHRLIDVVIALLIIVIWLLVLGIATTHLLLLIFSQLVVIVFIFGNTCKTLFEAIIFLFVMHPFDVGDRCVVDGVEMVVEEMNILSTVFLRYDNEKIYYPNSLLATKPISNFHRSPDMGDAFYFSVHIWTPMEKLAALKAKIASYLESKPHHWYANHTVIVHEIEDMNKMRMSLTVRHRMNYQNFIEKQIRRSDLILEMRKYFQELGIEYHLLPQEVHIHNS
ncbi:hypothetical protein O6H91_20G046400 [Diphasiastrum complanatum]|uniref:Uncharacterized protein n=1 Tax=Diphasiastrum complanatum TaxID=34168 RepID=A0ACC2AQ11_DIPCM|nr:hypothetical protein O6H91_20G046400 [Diphasiastrum complanatum]